MNLIKYNPNECVMCGATGEFISEETQEILCVRCNNNNNEARSNKRLPANFIKKVEGWFGK